MNYKNIKEGIFLSRPNRFIAMVEIDGKEEICHVKNTGRCRELLIHGASVYLEKSDNPTRKTKYDLVAVRKGERLINMDSQAPNAAVREWLPSLFPEGERFVAEAKFGRSRFDFYVEAQGRRIFLEVKGVTLEENGVVRFPDAPTERGVKHLAELAECVNLGYEAYVVFVIQMSNVRYFAPNDATHPAFGDALRRAASAGVKILARECEVSADGMTVGAAVEVILHEERKDGVQRN